MAAYGALTSLMHIIQQIQHHPRPLIFLDQKQVESLVGNIRSLLDFLEGYSNTRSLEADALESRIADAAYAAEDIIESQVVDHILDGSTSHGENISSSNFYQSPQTATGHGKNISSVDFYQGLQKVIQDMDFIKNEVRQIKEKIGVLDQWRRSSDSGGSSRSSSTRQNNVVGLDNVQGELMDRLVGHKSHLQIIPIVGMGGIGKTTLTKSTYLQPLILEHFDMLAWVTISQEYSTQEILLEALLCLNKGSREELSQMSEDELGEILHKTLSGKRYLIVMDDMWSIEAWNEVRRFFPDNNNGSRIMITTRLSNVAFDLSGTYVLEMNFLDEGASWNLFWQNAFQEKDSPFPSELEEIGKKIVRSCKGLPLALVVVGGLLAQSNHTLEYWEYVAENLNSILNSEDGEYCLKILYMSYDELPVHLKPCFLYMGVFSSQREIRVSELIKLWVAEGFLKPVNGKSLEIVAEEYLMDLIHRNLILAGELGSNGKIKFCNIHDLLRDLSLREAEKGKFLYVTRPDNVNISQSINTQRRIGIDKSTSNGQYLPEVLNALQSASLARSLICHFQIDSSPLNFRLLRLLKAVDKHLYSKYGYPLETIFQAVNSRYLAIRAYRDSIFPPSIYRLWNLQTLIVKGTSVVIAPSQIWKMPLLRHVEFEGLLLPDPPTGPLDGEDDFVLENLQTLLKIINFKCGEEVVNRIPNVKKLQISYKEFEEGNYYLNNLGLLHQLESLACFFAFTKEQSQNYLLQNLSMPHSLKKLTLEGSLLHWEDMATMVGSLPLLEVLKLRDYSFIGPEWETVEGQFCCLKFLLISNCPDLEFWTTDSTHFPLLERLVLRGLHELNEIPSSIGEIPTLESIQLENCSDSAAYSAKRIKEEQEEFGNDGFQVRVYNFGED